MLAMFANNAGIVAKFQNSKVPGNTAVFLMEIPYWLEVITTKKLPFTSSSLTLCFLHYRNTLFTTMVTASLTPTFTSSLSLAGVTILIVLRVSNRIEASSPCDNKLQAMLSSKHALYNSPYDKTSNC